MGLGCCATDPDRGCWRCADSPCPPRAMNTARASGSCRASTRLASRCSSGPARKPFEAEHGRVVAQPIAADRMAAPWRTRPRRPAPTARPPGQHRPAEGGVGESRSRIMASALAALPAPLGLAPGVWLGDGARGRQVLAGGWSAGRGRRARFGRLAHHRAIFACGIHGARHGRLRAPRLARLRPAHGRRVRCGLV